MPLRSLALRGFRNLATAELEIPEGLIAVVGANGAGKTNLLEAVAVLGNLVSFRGAPPSAWIQHGANALLLAGTIERSGANVELSQEIALRGTLRRVLLRGARRLGPGEYLELFPVATFSSQDPELIWGAPEQRRRFLDRVAFQLHPETYVVHQRYRRALKQRNALLLGGRPDEQMEVFEHDLAELGARLVHLRLRALGALEDVLEGELETLGWSLSRVNLRYHMGEGETASEPAATVRSLRVAYLRWRRIERARGHTLVGPHRHDLLMFLGGAPVREVLSAGQGKLLATAVKLAAQAAVEVHTGSRPTVVFDDADAELDATILARLVARLATARQVLLSSAHEEFLLPRLDAAKVWRMSGGSVGIA